MRLKSYFADSLQNAIDQARVDLGPDAMLVSSRQTSLDLRDLGAYEVVFGMPAASAAPREQPRAEIRREPEAGANNEVVLRELADLKRQLESFAASISRSQLNRSAEQFSPDLTRTFERLVSAGFSNETATELTEAAALRLPRDRTDLFSRELMRAILEEEVSSRFSVEPRLGPEGQSATAVMLVGPPGAGKTTSLIKLALHYGVKARRPLHVISLDTLRIGGCDQLLRYTRVIGTNLHTVDHFSALESALSEHRTGLTLIDTPGFAPAEDADIEQLALAKRDLPMEVQLVLPAYTRLDTAERVVARFDALKPARLLLTHMDTAAGPGTAMELAMKTALPLSFFGIGQQIPEDLQEADKAALLAELIPRERAAASRAA